MLVLALENGTLSKKGNTWAETVCVLNIWQLIQSGQFLTHPFGISISILCFKRIGFIKARFGNMNFVQ